MKEKGKKIAFIAVIIIIIAIVIMSYLKPINNPGEEIMKCIAEKSQLYVSKTCSHCSAQKQLLEPNLNFFNITDCTDNPEICQEKEITGVPTWIINNKKIMGFQTIENLKQLTGC